MAQQHDSYVYLSLSQLAMFLLQTYRVLFFDVDIFVIRNYAQHRDFADILQHPTTFLKESHIAAKFINNNSFNQSSVLRRLQGNATID